MKYAKQNIVLQKYDYSLLQELYYHHYLSLDIIAQIYGNITYRKMQSRLKRLRDKQYIIRHEIGSRKDRTHEIIYALGEYGFYCVTDFNEKSKFDKETVDRLKKGYMHQINTARILYAFKNNSDVQIYSERESYHFFGEDKNYTKVIRPDGAIVNVLNKTCMFLEYENEQKGRTFNTKLQRYEQYNRNRHFSNHPIIDCVGFSVVFVFNTCQKMNNAKEKFKKLLFASDITIFMTTLDLITKDPTNIEIYEEVHSE